MDIYSIPDIRNGSESSKCDLSVLEGDTYKRSTRNTSRIVTGSLLVLSIHFLISRVSHPYSFDTDTDTDPAF